jgi:cell division protein FtsB
VAGAVIAGGVVFGLWGGEYSTLDWWTLKRQAARERAAIVRLEREIDSLAPWADALERDPETQERVARERFGMIRPGEIVYQVEPEGR